MGDGLDVLQLLFLRYLQGCVNSCHHLLTQTGINCCVLNFSCLVSHHCRPEASIYLRLKRNLSNSFSFVGFHSLSVLCGNFTIVTTSLLDRNIIGDDGRWLMFLMLNVLIFCVIVMTSFFGRYRSRLTG